MNTKTYFSHLRLLFIGLAFGASAFAQTPANTADTTPPAEPELPVMTDAEAQKWLDEKFAESDKDDVIRKKNEADQKAGQRKQCEAARCQGQQTSADGKKLPPPCDGADDKKYQKAYCFGNKNYPNPYAIAELSKNDDAKSACYYYLSALASRRMDEAVKRNPKSADEFSIPQQVWKAESTCAPEELPNGAYYGLSALMIGPGAKEDGEKLCRKVIPSDCVLHGGEEVSKPGASGPLCMMDGTLLDPSCVKDPKKLAVLKTALKDIQGHGKSCLGGMAQQHANWLGEQFGRDGKTQICCAANCSVKVPGYAGGKGGFPEGGLADSSNGTPKGVVRINFDSPMFKNLIKGSLDGMDGAATASAKDKEQTLKGMQAYFNATLFHEYLHRIGMCTDPNHNVLNQPRVIAKSGDSCPSPYEGVTVVACFADSKGGFAEVGNADKIDAGGKIGSTAISKCFVGRNGKLKAWADYTAKEPPLNDDCVIRSVCSSPPDGLPTDSAATWPARRWTADPVYACEGACYGTQIVDGSKEPTSKLAEICKNAESTAPRYVAYDYPRTETGSFGVEKKTYGETRPLTLQKGESVCQ